VLSIYEGAGNVLARNQGWGAPVTVLPAQIAASADQIAAAATAVGAFALPAGSADSAVIVTLTPGSYTAEVTGSNGATGVALVEIYEITQ